jgi:hypothetical protein
MDYLDKHASSLLGFLSDARENGWEVVQYLLITEPDDVVPSGCQHRSALCVTFKLDIVNWTIELYG